MRIARRSRANSAYSASIFSHAHSFRLIFHPFKILAMKSTTMIWMLALTGWLPSVSDFPAQIYQLSPNEMRKEGVFRCDNGKVGFKSEAPLEVIQAKSNKLRGIIDTAKQSFAWTVEIKTFEGFNSPLQREHFNENYMESKKYSKASFAGKIIEKVDFQTNGTYSVRAKGKLNIHGVEQERIIKSQLEVMGDKIRVRASFIVPLADHNITVPKIVYQKIAEEIVVTMDAELN